MSYKFLFLPLFASFYFNAPLFSGEKASNNYYQNLTFVDQNTNETKDPGQIGKISITSSKKNKRKVSLSRADQIPQHRLEIESASYLEGYIQALIDANYYELNVLVYVDSDYITHLFNLPNDDRIKQSIIAFVADLPNVTSVEEGKLNEKMKEKIEERQGTIRQVSGVWFPESTVLFPPLIANPRDPVYSLSYRWMDNVLGKNLVAVSLGDVFPIFRWFNVFSAHGDLQIDIAACVWADFNMNPPATPTEEWAELVTTDYIIALPLTYAFKKWAFRLRVYHISSHLGDELMFNDKAVSDSRVNPSFEAIDFITSYQWTGGLRLYGGPGAIVNSDISFPMKYLYGECGLEYRFPGLRIHYHRLYGAPFFALDIQSWQVVNFRPSVTGMLGYEWSKLQGAGRKVRLFVEYHNGHSAGQYFDRMTQYVALRGSWGF